MKSAYELIRERLEKESPAAPISEAQKKALAEADSEFAAKIAERKLFLEGLIAKAVGDYSEVDKLRTQLISEIARLEEEREIRKEKIRRNS
jgi:phage shock protein A